jgi:quercetin dioxygenase-like cupin family protein
MKVQRVARWAMLSAGVAGVVTAVGITPSVATPPAALSQVPLARGTNVSQGTLPLQVGTDVAMAQITVEPGGSSGWHSHPGGAIIIVKQGSLTVNRALGSQCQRDTYSAGQAFIERPGEVDQVVNTGSVPFVILVTFPRVPQGAGARSDHTNPGVCPGL